MGRVVVTLEYQIATYSGEVRVVCDEDDEKEVVESMARAILKRNAGGFLPFGYESYKEIRRDYE